MATSAPRTDPIPAWIPRLVTTAGFGFALLLLITIAISNAASPEHDAPVAEWTAYAQENESDLRIAALLMGLAVYEWLLFLGVLRAHIGEAEETVRGMTRAGYMILAGGILGIAGLAFGVFAGAAAVSFPDASPEVIRAVSAVASSGFGIAAPGFAVMLITVGLVARPLRALPAWLSIVALVTGVAFLLQLGVLLSETEDNVFGIFYPLAFLGLFVFAIGATIEFLKRLRTA